MFHFSEGCIAEALFVSFVFSSSTTTKCKNINYFLALAFFYELRRKWPQNRPKGLSARVFLFLPLPLKVARPAGPKTVKESSPTRVAGWQTVCAQTDSQQEDRQVVCWAVRSMHRDRNKSVWGRMQCSDDVATAPHVPFQQYDTRGLVPKQYAARWSVAAAAAAADDGGDDAGTVRSSRACWGIASGCARVRNGLSLGSKRARNAFEVLGTPRHSSYKEHVDFTFGYYSTRHIRIINFAVCCFGVNRDFPPHTYICIMEHAIFPRRALLVGLRRLTSEIVLLEAARRGVPRGQSVSQHHARRRSSSSSSNSATAAAQQKCQSGFIYQYQKLSGYFLLLSFDSSSARLVDAWLCKNTRRRRFQSSLVSAESA